MHSEPIAHKVCAACGQDKPLTDFFARSKTDSRPRPRCKTCHNAHRRPADRWHALAVSLRRAGGKPSVPVLRAGLGDPTRCHICGESLTWETAEADHILPGSRGGSHDPSNLAWSHRGCNRLKGSRTMPELLALMERVLSYQRAR